MCIIRLINIFLLFACISTGFANKLYDSLTFTGYGALQMGQLVRGYYNAPYSDVSYVNGENRGNRLIEHQWIESLRSRFCSSFYKGHSLKINFGLEFNYNFVTINNPAGLNADNIKTLIPKTYYYDLLVHRADMEYRLLTTNKGTLDLQLGYFPFKYNPQATNLGEYLFRSETYPNHLVNEFYFAETRLLGTRLGGTLKGAGTNLHGNLFLTSEMTYPVQDFSLAGLVSADVLNGAIDLGGGIQFQRLIPVDTKRTTPRTEKNISYADTVNHDTTYYSYSGTKMMARICFDIKKLLPMSILGEEDFKVYSEYAILGLKDYDRFYDNISERMPFMFGMNIPGFKLIDLISLEFEYYTNPYYNNNRNQLYADIDNTMPAVPNVSKDPSTDPTQNGGYGVVTTGDHRWKWSLFAKKRIGKNFEIIAQAARDHSRFQDPMNRQTYYTYDGDVTLSAKDWYYQFRLMWRF
jgi:hypothetical protein